VSSKLLDMTSYQGRTTLPKGKMDFSDEVDEEDDFEADRDIAEDAVGLRSAAAATRENRMSFDDLGKVYTNISRKRILSKVGQSVSQTRGTKIIRSNLDVSFSGEIPPVCLGSLNRRDVSSCVCIQTEILFVKRPQI
jgi:hypothetical protein